MKPDPIIAYRQFVDGSLRPVYDNGGRQYVINDDGDRVYGVFYIPGDETQFPLIVRTPEEYTEHEGNGK
jgi:hypothetical protein